MIYSVCVCACVRMCTSRHVHMCTKDPRATATGVCKLPNVGAGNHTPVLWLKEEHNKSILLCELVGNCIVGNYIGAERLNSQTPLYCCEPWYSGKPAFGHWPLELKVWMSPWSCYFSHSKESWQSISTQWKRVLHTHSPQQVTYSDLLLISIGKTYRHNLN